MCHLLVAFPPSVKLYSKVDLDFGYSSNVKSKVDLYMISGVDISFCDLIYTVNCIYYRQT